MRLFTSELVKKYKSRTVVDHVSIDVNQGEIVGLLGPNGAGKTTTFYMIVGLITPNEGKIFLEKDDKQIVELTDEPVYRRAQMGVGYLAQEASVFRRLSVEDNIRAVLEMTTYSKEYQAERCESLIEEFRLQKVRKSLGIQLSGGERRRTEIARAVAINPAFILLDEPFAGVDPIAVEDIQSRDACHHRPHLSALRGPNPQDGYGGGSGQRRDGASRISWQELPAAQHPRHKRHPAPAKRRRQKGRRGIRAAERLTPRRR